MMVIYLVGLVSMILMRTLRKDYARYRRRTRRWMTVERDLGDEYWLEAGARGCVPAALTRPPLLRPGGQRATTIATVVLCVILFANHGGALHRDGLPFLSHGHLHLCCHTARQWLRFGGSLYGRMGGKQWIKQMLMSAFILPALVCGTAFLINFIAIYYHASRAIPFGTMVAVTCICLFIILPLTLVGTVLGRNLAGQPNYPCRINAVPRPIPEKKWFMEPSVIVVLGGILPFGSIFIEMYFIFTSFWAYKIYYVYGFMLLVFLILYHCHGVCSPFVLSPYFPCLNAEDLPMAVDKFSFRVLRLAGYVYLLLLLLIIYF
uniref:Transmembrane 9 superfamily member n=1 Tax=Ixodes ricinus TaxID=34613 RepID=V5HDP9_IXORI